MNGSYLSAHLSVLAANLIYGANYSIAKKVMPEFIEPFGFIFVRVIFTALLFLLLASFVKDKKVTRKDHGRLLLCALTGVALNQLLFFKGLDLTRPINAALMMTTNPIMVLVAASLLIGERITMKKISGIIIGIVGACFLIVFGKVSALGNGDTTGDIMILINSLSFGMFLIMVKPLMSRYHTFTVMKWIFLYGLIMVTPFGIREGISARWMEMEPSHWWAVAYVVIAVTALAYLFNTYALKRLSPSSVSIYIYLQPVFATLFAILFGEDHPQWLHLAAAALIFTGVYLVTWRGKPAPAIS
jgi:drug/metabolite transporter (DMT)-like permease